MKNRLRPAREVEERCARFQELCRTRGIRVTEQRLAVYRALAGDTAHPTADAIHMRLRRGMSSLSQATVYRILEFLENEGLVRRVSTTEGASRFEANLSRHQHLVCRLCGRITDCEEDLSRRLSLPRTGRGGFVAEEIDLRVVGRCGDCRPTPPRRPSKTDGHIH